MVMKQSVFYLKFLNSLFILKSIFIFFKKLNGLQMETGVLSVAFELIKLTEVSGNVG